jgi:Ca-activated chloride channel family protein
MDWLREYFGRLEWSWVLLALPLAVAAYAWASRQRRRSMQALGNPQLVRRLIGTVATGNRLVREIAVLLALAGIGVGLMRPLHGGHATVVPSAGLDIVLAVDYSKSMLADDVYPSRIERLEAELEHFLDDARKRGDRVGLVVFAGAARGVPLTSDTRLLSMYLKKADPRTENPGGTALGPAIKLGLNFLLESRRSASEAGTEGEADQVLVLMTDGEDTASRPLELIEEAKQVGVRVYTVGIGSQLGQPVVKVDENGEPNGWVMDDEGNPVVTRLDAKTLETIAKETRGKYIHVSPDRFGLDEVRLALSDLHTAVRDEEVEIEREEGYAFAIAPALLLLCLGLALPDRRRRRLEVQSTDPKGGAA